MQTEIEARYRVVTPLFCAGADPKGAELRLPSFKGVLRFWWRALAWSRCGGDLTAIRKEEDALFGMLGLLAETPVHPGAGRSVPDGAKLASVTSRGMAFKCTPS